MVSNAPQSRNKPAVGIGFRLQIAPWIRDNLSKFDVLEITVDHYMHGGDEARAVIEDLVSHIPLVAHGVGLSIGTDVPVDEVYLEQVARTIEDLKMPSFSEHLAWTKAPGIDLANLLPLPKNNRVAESIIEKIRFVQSYLSVPFSLENISYVFDYPDSVLTDAEFFNLIIRETGVGMLLDVENLYVNSVNHKFDPNEFLDALPPGIVSGVHVAGGPVVSRSYLDRPVWVDSHSDLIPDRVLTLLDRVLDGHRPETIVLERDNDVEDVDEISNDVERIRAYVDAKYGKVHADAQSESLGSAN
jgi:uncharacterized protein (UPF0276 family)